MQNRQACVVAKRPVLKLEENRRRVHQDKVQIEVKTDEDSECQAYEIPTKDMHLAS